MYDENADWRSRILGALRELKEDYRRDGSDGRTSGVDRGERDEAQTEELAASE